MPNGKIKENIIDKDKSLENLYFKGLFLVVKLGKYFRLVEQFEILQ